MTTFLGPDRFFLIKRFWAQTFANLLGQWGCSSGQFVAHVLVFQAIDLRRTPPAPDHPAQHLCAGPVWDPPLCCVVVRCGVVAGASHDSWRAQTCSFQGPGASNTTKIPRKDPQERKKENCGGREKKREILFPHPSSLHPSGPTVRGPTLQDELFGAPFLHEPETANKRFGSKVVGPKVVK